MSNEYSKIFEFLSNLLGFKETTPPIIEMMTILKLRILQLETDYEIALQQLNLEDQLFSQKDKVR